MTLPILDKVSWMGRVILFLNSLRRNGFRIFHAGYVTGQI